MTDHPYQQHPVWDRDQCEYISSDPEDTNAICGMPRSAHAVAPCEVCGRPSVGVAGSGVPGTPIDEVCFRVKAGADTTCYEIGYWREKARAAELRAALEKYGCHDIDTCDDEETCSCGLTAALAPIPEASHAAR